jgi:NitT/TauT family transport system substrate-binding protein
MLISRRGLAAAALAVAFAGPVLAADKVAVGALRFVSSGGIFLALERGYFAAEGIEVELKFFEAAQPIAVAVVSGDVQFGVTGLTAGAYNLAAKGGLVVVAAQGAEKKGVVGNQLVVSNDAYAKGLTSPDKLAGASAAISQVGSTFHYQFGQIAAAKGFDLAKIALKPLQSLPNMVAAVKTGQVDAAILPPHLAGPLAERGEAKVVAPLSDIADYQFGGLFTSPAQIAANRALVERFVRAYQKGLKDYDAALMRTADGKRVSDETAMKAATEIGKYVYPSDAAPDAAKKVIASAPYCEPTGKLDLANIEAQIAWYKAEKLVDAGVEAKKFVDTSFAK